VDIETIGRTLESLLGSRQVTRFSMNDKQYDVLVQVADFDRRTPDMLSEIYVRGNGGQMVQLSNLVTIRETIAPKELYRFNQMRAVTIDASVAPGSSLGEALALIEAAALRVLPAGTNLDYNGQSREFKQTGSSLIFVFLLALLFIFLVLAAQFESWADPFIIMMSVPLSIAGALLMLWQFGGTLNVYSQIGMVTLIGLITKHGILIVAFANQLRDQGLGVKEAAMEAAVLRLRPILMTTGAMVLGAVPLAFATGAGAESRQQIGLVIVGGMTVGTFFTLFVVPTVFTLIAGLHKSHTEAAAPAPVPAAGED
ncbi:MAG: efflux RND transporter permease subunit, partial [Alphaproteobacteria bacterium]|nr:efflux RND transporter permease subunit [Alphaproteobacteria bacterium]